MHSSLVQTEQLLQLLLLRRIPGLINDATGGGTTATNYDLASSKFSTSEQEALGDAAGTAFMEMAFSIDKIAVESFKGRALRADYSVELAQDLKAIHGLDAESELANILSTEILAEINREVVRTVYRGAKPGAQLTLLTRVYLTLTLTLTVDGLLRNSRDFYSRLRETQTQSHRKLVEGRVMLSSHLLM